jgi:low affinity Fe/Cu permease
MRSRQAYSVDGMMREPEKKEGMREHFRKFAQSTSQFVGTPWTFSLACLVIVGWAACGPMFKFSDTWQLVINTGTTIITFLMVFLIQSTQNRDTRAIHLKLDELIRALKGARNKLVNLEAMTDEELDRLQAEFERECGVRRQVKHKHRHTEAPSQHHENQQQSQSQPPHQQHSAKQ